MRFSIVVPIYNVERYLRQCIESALNQTFGNFELILVDDGAADNCGSIIDEYAQKDKRIVAVHKQNGGLVSARKAGAAQARGEYIIVLDGDDWLALNCLEEIEKAIRKETVDVVCFGSYYAVGNQYQEKQLVKEERIVWRETIEQSILPNLIAKKKNKVVTPNLWGKAFRRELYLKHQQTVSEKIAMGEDGVVVFPCMCEAQSLCFLPECLYYYRMNPTSMTQSKKKQIPWEGALLRIQHLKEHLPLDQYGMEQQLGCYTAHAVFNVLLTQMQHRKYTEVTKEARDMLEKHQLIPIIKKAKMLGDYSEKLAQVSIGKKWFFAVKLYAMLK